MPDFSTLLRKPAGEAKKAPSIPGGDYPAVIKSFELGDDNTKKTPYVRFHVGLIDWAQGVPDQWEVPNKSTGKTDLITKADVDLSKKQMRRDFYLTEDALWRLDEFLRAMGVEPQGKTYEECLPAVVGGQVLAGVVQALSEKSGEFTNFIDKIVAAH